VRAGISSFGRLTDARFTSNGSILISTPDEILRPKYSGRNTDWTSSTELAFHRRSPSAADDKLECSTTLRRNWIDPKYWIGYWLNSSNWRNSNWKPNSCLIPTLSLDDPLTQPWEILSEATPSQAPEIAVKPKFIPWYEMMTSHARTQTAAGWRRGKVTTCSEKNEVLTVHEQWRLWIVYGSPLVTDEVLISKKLVQSIPINPRIIL